jgi:hypothetical protein
MVTKAALSGGRFAPTSAKKPVRNGAATHMGRDEEFDRPVFIVSSPRSGSTLLFETLARWRNVYTVGGESHGLIQTIDGLHCRHAATNPIASTSKRPRPTFRVAARALSRRAARSQRRRAAALSAAHARKDTEEFVARSVSCTHLSGGALHLSVSRAGRNARQHDRGVGVGHVPHLCGAARLERTAVVAAVDARLARPDRQAVA